MRWNVGVSLGFIVVAGLVVFFSYQSESVYGAVLVVGAVQTVRYWLSFPASS